MAYSAPSTQSTGYTVTATNWNELVNNQLYFAARPVAFLSYKLSSDASTTSTSFVDVDASNIIITKTINTGRAAVFCQCRAGGAGIITALDIIVDSTTRAGISTYGICSTPSGGGGAAMIGVFTGLSAASHTFKLQYKALTAGTTVVESDSIVTMFLWEL